MTWMTSSAPTGVSVCCCRTTTRSSPWCPKRMGPSQTAALVACRKTVFEVCPSLLRLISRATTGQTRHNGKSSVAFSVDYLSGHVSFFLRKTPVQYARGRCLPSQGRTRRRDTSGSSRGSAERGRPGTHVATSRVHPAGANAARGMLVAGRTRDRSSIASRLRVTETSRVMVGQTPQTIGYGRRHPQDRLIPAATLAVQRQL
jgi:hypothetical protein